LLITDKTAGSTEKVADTQKVESKKEDAIEPAAEDEAKKTKAATPSEGSEPAGSEALIEEAAETVEEAAAGDSGPRVVGKIDLESMNQKTRPSKKPKVKDKKSKEEVDAEAEVVEEGVAAAEAPVEEEVKAEGTDTGGSATISQNSAESRPAFVRISRTASVRPNRLVVLPL